MRLTKLRPTLWTENLHATVDFYVQVLGFICEEFNEHWGWASLWKDEVELMVSAPDEHSHYHQIGFTGSFYFNVENVDALWSQLKDRVAVSYEPENFEWGMREFGIYDNNGYLLQFGQEI
jgi:uncharacterized glyoxalase superfamily protein PhnB